MRRIESLAVTVGFCCVLALVAGCAEAGPIKPPAHPAKIRVDVAPDAVAAGDETTVTVQLEPIDGIKINRYPKTKIIVAGDDGLVEAGEASVGNDTPPPPDKMATNYFEDVEPLTLTLRVADGAAAGAHEVDAALTFFYCMPANGFCAPKRETVRIPITVR